jgi:putative Mg2+ transporter-C (MgtC) family protein
VFPPTIDEMLGETLPWSALASRLGLAMLVGAVIGLDRRRTGKPAGMRTHMLVALGSCVFVLVPLDLGASVESVSRTIQGIATGIGFLGAGEILHRVRQDEQKVSVKGLTSAAAVWTTAALGMAAGCGLWRVVVLGLVATLLILTLVGRFEHRLFGKDVEEEEVP